jgi:hypothetical protein
MKNAIRMALVGLMALGLMGGAASAHASSDEEVIQRGDCSQASDWKLRIRTDGPDRLDLEFEAGEVANQQWRVQMRYNGTLVFNGTATSGIDGEFDVDREVDNQAGPDTLSGKARNLVTGETCVGSVTADF